MTFAAVDVTLRVGAGVTATRPGPGVDLPRGGGLPITGASLVTLVAAAVVMVVLGSIFLLHTRQEDR